MLKERRLDRPLRPNLDVSHSDIEPFESYMHEGRLTSENAYARELGFQRRSGRYSLPAGDDMMYTYGAAESMVHEVKKSGFGPGTFERVSSRAEHQITDRVAMMERNVEKLEKSVDGCLWETPI